MRATIFLRQPAGVAIRTEFDNTADALDSLLNEDVVWAVNERGESILIPADNIASIEVKDANA